MYYKLYEPYRLRGWDGLPFCLASPHALTPRLLSQKEFAVLLCCDGMTEFGDDNDESVEEIISTMLQDRVISPCEAQSSILDYQKVRKHPNGHIHGVIWSITGDCNLRCKHCYMSGGRNKYTDLTKNQLFDMIAQFEEAGVMEVELSGGEPQMSPYLWEIVDELLRRNIVISHFHTNAMLLDDEFFSEMKKRNLFWMFDSSLDGVGTHDSLRGTPGVEKTAIAAFYKIREQGYPLLVNSKFHADSVPAALDTYALMKGIGVTAWKVSFVFPIGEAVSNVSSVPAITCDEYLELLKRYKADGNPFELNLIEGVAKGYRGGSFAFWENDKEDVFNQQRVSCGLCRNRPYILPDSTLVPCIGWVSTPVQKLLPKLINMPLSEIYADSGSLFRKLVGIKVSDITEQNAECRDCEHKLTCGGGCRADALATNHGNDAIYRRGMMMCGVYKGGFMEKVQEICGNRAN
ncbi:radical SAM protein [Anaerocolumna sedimenticola]|uniref:Radical SAM protein n=1 Tax=Anaerocolumna sedimenticola TaxID=2696063 RepID=A0A6P1TSY4_9FIRM|nr:radical SAM protein [Anaerocolumna sedimenticola]QHQ62575.1 radical SAM protein [Anaerocolumna sedimenticola]